ncbi:MAG: type IV secretory system conjugative DNA transfer family protein [Candidatus Paceibacterota bacterium]|jgi:hypothetical protein
MNLEDLKNIPYNLEDPNRITYFAETDSRNKRTPFGIRAKDRPRHVYTIGKTGMGKSTLLENMAIQDLVRGEGIAFIDPHGKTAELLLDYVPENRIKDVLYFAPFDMDYPISFNVMEDVGPDKRHLVANGLMSAFKKIWVDAWSARMEYILNNIILALLEYPDSTLLGVNRMLSDKDYRKRVVSNVSDVSVKAFWVDEFEKYGERYMQEAGAAIQNKIGQFISNPLVRNLIGQPKSTFDLRKMMDERKIILVNLSKGRVGEANASLLGSMLITKIYLAAMSRADVSEATLHKLPNFYLYVDEFQSFANESFADILSEARKYKLNLTIAHQYIEQMSDEVRAAVFGNVGTMISFRVGATDAEVFEKEFAPVFTGEDLVNLGFAQVYMKLMIDGVSSTPFSATTIGPIARPDIMFKDQIIEASRSQFARPRRVVEEEIMLWHKPIQSSGGNGNGKGENSGGKGREDRGARGGTGKIPRETFQSYEGESHQSVSRDVEKQASASLSQEVRRDIPQQQGPQKSQASHQESRNQETPHVKSNSSPAAVPEHKPFEKVFKEVKITPVAESIPEQHIHGAPGSRESEREIMSAVSLTQLQRPQEQKKSKGPTKESVNALREALAGLVKKDEVAGTKKEESLKKEEKPVSAIPSKQNPPVGDAAGAKQTSQGNVSEKKTPEVPEDVLRKILDINNEE